MNQELADIRKQHLDPRAERLAGEKTEEPGFKIALVDAINARREMKVVYDEADHRRAGMSGEALKSLLKSYIEPKRGAGARVRECERLLLALYKESYNPLLKGTGYSVSVKDEVPSSDRLGLEYKRPRGLTPHIE